MSPSTIYFQAFTVLPLVLEYDSHVDCPMALNIFVVVVVS